MRALLSLPMISSAIFFTLGDAGDIIPPVTIPDITFQDCNSTQQSIVKTAWTNALEILKSIGPIDVNSSSTLDWWGPAVQSSNWTDAIQSKYKMMQQYLSRSPNGISMVNAFCRDPPNQTSCGQYADLELAREDPSWGFYSYTYALGTGSDPDNKTLNLVLCDTFFDPKLLQPFNNQISKHGRGSNHTSVEPYWFTHASEVLKQGFIADLALLGPQHPIKDNVIFMMKVNQTGLGNFTFPHPPASDTADSNPSGYSPEMAKTLARFVQGPDSKPLDGLHFGNVANWVGYALSRYIESRTGEYPMYPIVTAQFGGSDLCNEHNTGPGGACSTIVLNGNTSAWNDAVIAENRWHDQEHPEYWWRPGVGEFIAVGNFYPDRAYPDTYIKTLSELRALNASLSPGTTMVPAYDDIDCLDTTESSVPLPVAYEGIQALCRAMDLNDNPKRSSITGTLKLTLQAHVVSNGTLKSGACSPQQCAAAFFEGMTKCMNDTSSITGAGGSANIACNSNTRGTFSWEIGEMT